MSWNEFITHMLGTTNKVDDVAVLNNNGQCIAVTKGLEVTDRQGRALLACLTDHTQSLARVSVHNNDYKVFRFGEKTIIGRNPLGDNLLVGEKVDDCVVLVFGHSEGHGSFLFELKKNLKRKDNIRNRRQVVSATNGQIHPQRNSNPTALDEIFMAADIEAKNNGVNIMGDYLSVGVEDGHGISQINTDSPYQTPIPDSDAQDRISHPNDDIIEYNEEADDSSTVLVPTDCIHDIELDESDILIVERESENDTDILI